MFFASKFSFLYLFIISSVFFLKKLSTIQKRHKTRKKFKDIIKYIANFTTLSIPFIFCYRRSFKRRKNIFISLLFALLYRLIHLYLFNNNKYCSLSAILVFTLCQKREKKYSRQCHLFVIFLFSFRYPY